MGRRRENRDINYVIVTGLSGAGKTQAMHCFEDLGFFCIDNLPPKLLASFTSLLYQTPNIPRNVALGMDIRGGEFFEDFLSSLKFLEQENIGYQIVFLEADPQVLVARFKEARRTHPLARGGSILKAIEKEKEMLSDIKERAHQTIDTSRITIWDLKKKIGALFVRDSNAEITIQIVSFGFKYGVPQDADIIQDVRFLPNPNYEHDMQGLTGKDRRARQFVLNARVTADFMKLFFRLIEFVVPHNLQEGKRSLVIAIGCTGGKHRSVVIAEELKKRLSRKYKVSLTHRDIFRK